jgi:hypothetical protein
MSRVNLRAAGLLGLLTCLLIAVTAAPAWASWGHSTSFHKSASEGSVGEPVGVSVDEAGDSDVQAGTIYVGELFAGLRSYNSADETVAPPSFFGGYAEIAGVAVNPVSHRVYVVKASEHKIATFEPSDGAEVGSFAIPGEGNIFSYWMAMQIASDAHGNVYVPEVLENKVEVFDESGGEPEGGVAKEIGVGALSKPEGVAIDPAGNIWVADTGGQKIDEFSPADKLLNEITSIAGVQSVAVDAAGDVFAVIGASEPYVVEYKPSSPSGASVLAEFGKGMFAEELFGIGDGIAIDRAHELVYVTDTNHNVIRRFASWAVASQAPSDVAEEQGALHATLHGTMEVEAGTKIPACEFEYGTTTAYGSSVPCSPAGEYTANTPVSATLSGLTPGVDYHYRISATNAGGFTQVGSDQEFGPAVIESESSWNTERTSSELRAEIDSLSLTASCRLQYVDEEQFKASGYDEAISVACAPESLPASVSVAKASVHLNGLDVGTTYHYRFVVASAASPEGAFGPDQTFTTFAVQSFAIGAFGPLAEANALAGSHPYELTTTITFPTTYGISGAATAEANPRDIDVALPPGLIGNPDAVEKCPAYDVAHALCSGASQVGTLTITGSQGGNTTSPLYNLVPPKGMPAQFGGRFNGFVTSYINTELRSGSDYGITAESLSVSTGEGVTAVAVTMWGVPGDPSHNAERYCPSPDKVNEVEGCTEHGPLTPFLRNPTSCAGVRAVGVHADSWQEPDTFVNGGAEMPAVGGCGKLNFEPSIEAQPTAGAADSPTGMRVDVHVPQPEGCTEEEGGAVECELAESDLKDATVAFPSGMTVNPSSADGLEACSEKQVGFTGFKELDPEAEAGVKSAQFTPGPAECPNGARLGTVIIHTPLLEHPIDGGLYLATPHANPFGSLVAVYMAVYDPISGVVIKLPGQVHLDPSTGQISTTFDQNPQLPFTDLEVDLFGGKEDPAHSRASLTTPQTCGSYTTTSVLAPWDGNPASTPAGKAFQVSAAPGGGACAKSEGEAPNAPVFEAGTASPVGGAYSPFVLKLKREDGSQHFGSLNVTLPPGLTGKIAGIEQCPQVDIEAAEHLNAEGEGAVEQAHPSCPAGSEVGVVHVGVGSGAPYHVTGRAYFAGPYKGAPFSLVVLTPAVAGPFDLGTVVVRAALFINPSTAQVTVKSDPFPTILDGIPLDIRDVGVDVNRNEFTLNPTSCATMAVTGEEPSTTGNTAALSDRFQAGGCANLPFKPGFSVSTSAKATREDGTSVTFKITYPASALGKEAWLSAAKFEFPKQLPARLSTIQKACPVATFNADPASCGVGSRIGSAVVRTQLLPVPLEGPVYFVSNGNQKFPEAVIVLQGDGVTINLHSETFIDEKTGVTSATLPAIPGVPFEEATVTLPSGKYSEFTANTSLCTSKTVTVKKKVTVKSKGHRKTVTRKVKQNVTGTLALKMPTTLTGQNGAQIAQSTPIAVTGCPKALKSKAKKHKSHTKTHKKNQKKTGKGKRGK